MSPTPPSTTSSSAGGQSPDNQYRVVRKRNRVPLSCGPCRHRKLKCNRTHPCDNCVRRGDAASCSYAAPGTRKKNQAQGNNSPDDMQNRIDRLEGLVLSLMTNGAQSAGPAAAVAAISRSTSSSGPSPGQPLEADPQDDDMIKEEAEEGSEVEDVSSSFGALKVDNEKGKSTYFGDNHWHMVLADISEVKNYFVQHKKELEQQYTKVASANPSTALGGPVFLFGAHAPITEGELRAGLPSRSAVEKLVSRYFNSLDPSVYTLHYPTFHKQLNKHFQDPTTTCIVWLGLLYSILCLAMQSYNKIGDEPPEWKGNQSFIMCILSRNYYQIGSFLQQSSNHLNGLVATQANKFSGRTLALASEYRLRTVQCLLTSDYTKSVDNTIETLTLYIHGEYSSRWDAEVGIWVVIGMIVRLAMRMGYHRDPKYFPNITPFQGEMRRRVWSFVRQADIMFSFQLALPHMIRMGDCDVDLPRNIFDDEFGPDSKELPAARPITEPTPFSYMLAKTELAFVFGEIVEQINSISGRTAPYDEVMKYDNKLRQVQASMAPHMKLRPLDECTHDPATLLVQRLHIDILYQKAMCVLHRRYLTRARQNPRYAHSRRACVEASMEILRHQTTLYRESQIGGRLRTMKWVLNSLTKHDLLLGAMIVCLDLHYDSLTDQPYDPYFWTAEQRVDMFRALESTQKIWKESAEISIEAYKASNIIAVMLEKLKKQERVPQSNSMEPRTTNEAFAAFDDSMQPEHSAAMTLGMLSSGGLTPNTASLFSSTMPLTPGVNKYANLDMNMSDAVGNTGMTPNFGMDGTNPLNMNGAASPFSQVFGNMGSGQGMVDIPATLDWEAWDSYIQNGNSVDSSLQFYPNPFDTLQPNLQDMQGDPNGFGNSVFMGANTPGKN